MIPRVSLIIVSIHWETGNFYTVKTEDEDWAPLIDDTDPTRQPVDTVRDMFEKVSDLSANWMTPTIRSAVFDDDGQLTITYTCNIPLDTVLTKGYVFEDAGQVSTELSAYNSLVEAVRSIS